MGPDELVRMGHVASRHYRDGLTRVEIAEELGISRFKVGRLLDRAREMGIVRVEITTFGTIDVDLSVQLRKTFGLYRALAVITPDTDDEIMRHNLGSAAAQLLSEIIEEGDLIGLAAGRTLNAMSAQLSTLPHCDCVGLGGVASPVVEHGIEVVRQFAQAAGGRSWPIFAPLLVDSPSSAKSLRQDPHISQAYSRFPEVTKAVVAIGSLNPPDSQLYDAAQRLGVADRFLTRGAAGEMLSTLYDENGSIIDVFDDVSLAMSETQLRAVPEVIAVAGGQRKTAAVLAGLRTGIIDSLVTDFALAQRLLQR